jgi:predicted small secreted protein
VIRAASKREDAARNAGNLQSAEDLEAIPRPGIEFRERAAKENSCRSCNKGKTRSKGNYMKKILLMLVLAGAAITGFTGCNTMHGAGKDVERAGEKVQDASK